MDAPPINLAPVLQQLLKGHGIDGSIDGEWVTLPRAHARASAAVVDETQHGESLIVVQLDLRVFIAFGRMIVESFTGFGQDREEAVRDAINAFVDGAFHVILAACFGVATDQVERERWTIAGKERPVTVGPAQCRGMDRQPMQFDVGWFDQFKAAIVRHDLAPGTHWVRLYVSHSDRRMTECEVLLDNDPWPAVQDAARQLDWPRVDGFASHRIFLIIQPGADRDVADLAGVIYELRDRDDAAIAGELVRRGLSAREAQLAVALIPLAFGRVALKTLVRGFADEMILVAPSGREPRSLRLGTNDLFIQATKLARDAVDHGTLTQDQFSALALRSVEVRAVNNALQAGSKAENLVLAPPTLALAEAIRDDGPAIADAPGQGGPLRRSWWRFWA